MQVQQSVGGNSWQLEGLAEGPQGPGCDVTGPGGDGQQSLHQPCARLVGRKGGLNPYGT